MIHEMMCLFKIYLVYLNPIFLADDEDLLPVVTLLFGLALNYRFLCSGAPSGKVKA